jgi:hypothetical protein
MAKSYLEHTIVQNPLCPSNPYPPAPSLPGDDDCLLDVECQEIFGVDYECFKANDDEAST